MTKSLPLLALSLAATLFAASAQAQGTHDWVTEQMKQPTERTRAEVKGEVARPQAAQATPAPAPKATAPGTQAASGQAPAQP